MSTYSQEQTPQQETESTSIFDVELPSFDDVLSFFTGSGPSTGEEAVAAQNGVGNAAVQEQLFGACTGSSSSAKHVVKQGETLSLIAKQYTGDVMRYEELAAENGISAPYTISAGDELTLPESWGAGAQDDCTPTTDEGAINKDDSSWMDDASAWVSDTWDSVEQTAGDAWAGAEQGATDLVNWASDGVDGAIQGAQDWWAGDEEGVEVGEGVDPEHDQASPGLQQDDDYATMHVTDAKAVLRGEDLAPLDPEVLIPKGSYIRIIDEKIEGGKTYVKVAAAKTSNGPTGQELGWTMASNLGKIGPRPARPSDPAAQMQALLTASATTATPAGYCYRQMKKNIKAAGGFGDILDIYSDERFNGFQASAVNFSSAVDRLGEPAFDLQKISGLPADASPGTLMVIKGNGQQRLSTVHGDINVIAGTEGGGAREEVRKVTDKKALIRDEDMQALDPEQVIPKDDYIWVLGEKDVNGQKYLQVAEAEGEDAEEFGEIIGWTAASNVRSPNSSQRMVKVYNDGVMRLPADANTWTSGRYKGVLIGMYQPVARK